MFYPGMQPDHPYNAEIINSLINEEKKHQRNGVCIFNIDDVKHLQGTTRTQQFKETYRNNVVGNINSLVFPLEETTDNEVEKHINLVHAEPSGQILTIYGKKPENSDTCTDLEQHASALCKKIFRKNGCSIDRFETEWKDGLTSIGAEDCAVLAIEEIKLLARKKKIEEKEYTQHEIKTCRLKHILEIEDLHKD